MSDRATALIEEESLRLDFLARIAKDRADGRLGALAEYLEPFPARYHGSLARTWLGLQGAPVGADADRSGQESGRTLGPFVLREELGRGGQAIVWLAEDERVGRCVALKTVPRSPLLGEMAPRLEREAQALARVSHPGLGEVYDVGAEDGVAWIAMRLEEGRTLADRIATGDTTARPAQEVVGWLESAARALHAAHEAGFLHRDVKPSNVMVRDDGHVVLLDFGVATSDASPVSLTLTGQAVGTPAYMAPEVLTTTGGPADRRADVWALGVTLFEALSGRRPFHAPTREDESRRIHLEEADALPAVVGLRKRDLDTVVATTLAKDPELRYATAEALADDLARLRAGDPPLARRPGPALRFRRWAHRRPALAAALVALLLALVASVTLYVRSEGQLRDLRRLADLETARDLIAARASLFPLTPAAGPRMDLWRARAEELFEREAVHRATLAHLPPAIDDAWAHDGVRAEAWVRAQLEELLDALVEVRALYDFLGPRARLAHDLERMATVEHASAWRDAAARVAADPRFGALELRPQLGLAPLGPDPASGLEEFAHLQSGSAAERDATTGRLVLGEDTGVVLVLVPGGVTVVGCSEPGAGLPHPDPRCGPWDGPPQSVRLDPFLLSKYELTQGQWVAHTGENPSRQRTEGRFTPGSTLLHPLESVPIVELQRVLAELGLELPTEVQWEHAARAGSQTPFSFGDGEADIGRFGNVADQSVAAVNAEVGWTLTPGVHDGHIVHAPVGSYLPNAWGLHDVHGNVYEATRSSFEDWRETPPQDGDGSTEQIYDLLVFRGGAFNVPAHVARLSVRNGRPGDVKFDSLGARPLRRLER